MGRKGDTKEIISQETRYQFGEFSNDDGVQLGLTILELARAKSAAVTIDVRLGQQQLFHAALNGTSPDNDHWVRRKSNSVLRFHRASLRLGLELQEKGTTMQERYGVDPADYTSDGGSFPIIVRSVGVIGAVTVSGLTQTEDHDLVIEGIRTYLNQQAAGSHIE